VRFYDDEERRQLQNLMRCTDLCQHTNEAYQKVTQTNMDDEFERKNLENQLVSSMEERET
jgi:hypothetical protein